jgi:hypothetical protein
MLLRLGTASSRIILRTGTVGFGDRSPQLVLRSKELAVEPGQGRPMEPVHWSPRPNHGRWGLVPSLPEQLTLGEG